MSTLLTVTWIITVDDADRVLSPGWLLIEGDRIGDLGGGEPPEAIRSQADEWLDLPGRALIPGITNGHTHLFQTFLRGVADDLALEAWLAEVIYTNARHMTAAHVVTAALLGCVENLKSGATFLIDNHYLHTSPGNSDAVLAAMETSGIRGMLARGAINSGPDGPDAPSPAMFLREPPERFFAEMDRLLAAWQGRDGRLELAVGPGATWAVTPAFARDLGDYARAHDLPIHIHTAETRWTVEVTQRNHGLREVEWLRSVGLLGERTHMAHAIWLDEGEIRLAADHGATAIHCPVSNMYLASGVMDLPGMRSAGLRIGLGSDGPASNNSQDNLEVLKATACLHKIVRLDPAIVSAPEVLRYACRGGAEAVGKGAVLGSLEAGKYADIVAVNLHRAHIGPIHQPVSALVYNANGNDVDLVLVGGRIVVQDGRCVTIDEAALMTVAQQQIAELQASASGGALS